MGSSPREQVVPRTPEHLGCHTLYQCAINPGTRTWHITGSHNLPASPLIGNLPGLHSLSKIPGQSNTFQNIPDLQNKPDATGDHAPLAEAASIEGLSDTPRSSRRDNVARFRRSPEARNPNPQHGPDFLDSI